MGQSDFLLVAALALVIWAVRQTASGLAESSWLAALFGFVVLAALVSMVVVIVTTVVL